MFIFMFRLLTVVCLPLVDMKVAAREMGEIYAKGALCKGCMGRRGGLVVAGDDPLLLRDCPQQSPCGSTIVCLLSCKTNRGPLVVALRSRVTPVVIVIVALENKRVVDKRYPLSARWAAPSHRPRLRLRRHCPRRIGPPERLRLRLIADTRRPRRLLLRSSSACFGVRSDCEVIDS